MHILLDMDGVIANFHLSALKAFNQERLLESWPIGEWSVAKVLGITDEQFVDQINLIHDFWFHIEPYVWMQELIELVQSFSDFTITTHTTGFDPDALAQKVAWLQKYIRPNFSTYMMGPQKYLMANQQTVLIDDNETNVEQFELAGGHALLFPMRTNKHYWMVDQRFEWLKQALERIFQC
jgi:5'(3')-deoxyribonucleotidase